MQRGQVQEKKWQGEEGWDECHIGPIWITGKEETGGGVRRFVPTWVQFSATIRTVARQAALSLDSPGKSTGVGCHFLLQRDLLDPGITFETPLSTASKEGSLPTAPSGKPKEGDKTLKQNKTNKLLKDF